MHCIEEACNKKNPIKISSFVVLLQAPKLSLSLSLLFQQILFPASTLQAMNCAFLKYRRKKVSSSIFQCNFFVSCVPKFWLSHFIHIFLSFFSSLPFHFLNFSFSYDFYLFSSILWVLSVGYHLPKSQSVIAAIRNAFVHSHIAFEIIK